MGNLTRDPELHEFDGGAKVANFGLAINETYLDRNGEQQENVCFVDVETWARQAEIVTEFLSKGRQVLIEGSLKYDTWEDKESGANRNKLTVRAFNVRFTGTRADSEDYDGESTGSSNYQERTSSSTPASKVEDDIPF